MSDTESIRAAKQTDGYSYRQDNKAAAPAARTLGDMVCRTTQLQPQQRIQDIWQG